ncbi:MAG: LysM peptidoglycan-binding domain-containing protein [Bacilli bacterium]|nr:LysM peptidoglycan-binding domain-containing protein [Bacilli bacterium]
MYTIYQVKSGDTLASIANKYGIPMNDLSSINGIMMGTNLNPGDYIVVPKMDNENLYFTRYVIQDGDTIYSIARKYNIDSNYLLRLNGLNENDTVYSGDYLFVPKDGVKFYITGMDNTLSDVISFLGVTPDEFVSQNNTIYLTNDQLFVYRK